MNSGFASFATRGKVSIAGTHQKFDREAFRILSPMINPHHFPLRREILKFEGYGGPDGLKVKGNYTTDHLWDPINEIGSLPVWVESHYNNLVISLKNKDYVEASFHAGYMAHYITDALTPAHHMSYKLLMQEYDSSSLVKKGWKNWGAKGWKRMHFLFESGISTATIFSPLRVKFDLALTEAIRKDGIESVIKDESLKIAKHHYFEDFIKHGWTARLAKSVRATVVPKIPQLIAAAWLAAYQEAWTEEPSKRLAVAARQA